MTVKNTIPSVIRHFVRDYRLPIAATIIFIGIVLFMFMGRLHDRSVLGEIISVDSSGTQDYAALLSKDSSDGFQRNDVPDDDDNAENSRSSGSRQITINTSPSNGTNANPSSSPSPSPSPVPITPSPSPVTPAVFSASISNFGQSRNPELQCSSGSITSGNILKCSKTYYFGANVTTLNGPGTVDYKWQYSVSSAVNGSFAATSGTNITPVSNQLTLSCREAATFTAQLSVTRPNNASSQTLTINHTCT